MLSAPRKPPHLLHCVLALLLASGAPLAAEPSFTATEVALPPSPEEPQPVQQADRKEGASAAAAMAMVGAAIAGVNCVMLLKQAKETTDPAMKALLRSQGLDQCAQAAKNAQSAAENKESERQLTSNEPKSPGAPAPAAPETQDEPSVAQSPPQTAAPTQVADADTDTDPDPQVFDYTQNSNPGLSLNNGSGNAGEPISNLSPIDVAQLGYDDSVKGSTTSGGSGGMLNGLGSAANGSVDSARGLASNDKVTGAPETKGKRGKNGEIEEGAGGVGEEGGPAGADMSSILAKIMGGPGEAESTAGANQLADLHRAPSGASEKTPNIFEYAGYRMRKARKEGLIKPARVSARTVSGETVAWVKP